MLLNIHQDIVEKLEYFYQIHKIPNIIFHGPSGSGKRKLVGNFIHKIYNGDTIYVEGYNDAFRATIYDNAVQYSIPYV